MFENLITTKVTNERWLNLYKTTFLKDGIRGEWVFASRRRGPGGEFLGRSDAVVIAAIIPEPEPARVVVMREYRVPIQGYEHHFPSGLVEAGQTIEGAVRKELLKEAGCVLDTITLVSPPLVSSAGMSDELSQLVFCTCKPGAGQRLEALFVGADELEGMLFRPGIFWAAKSWPVLMYHVLPLLRKKK